MAAPVEVLPKSRQAAAIGSPDERTAKVDRSLRVPNVIVK
jgi:hypothetical protein